MLEQAKLDRVSRIFVQTIVIPKHFIEAVFGNIIKLSELIEVWRFMINVDDANFDVEVMVIAMLVVVVI